MLRKVILILFTLFFLTYAADKEENFSDEFGFALHAGLATGTGIAFRKYDEKKGHQFTVLPLYFENFRALGFGYTRLYRWFRLNDTIFLSYLAISGIYSESNTETRGDINYITATPSLTFHGGGGLGFENMLTKRLSWYFMGGLKASIDPLQSDNNDAGLSGEFGIHYRFWKARTDH